MGHRARLEDRVNLRAAFVCRRGLYNPSVLPTLKTQLKKSVFFAAFLRRSPLPTSIS
jgi:hypothetical protein